jgi:outer membrane protein assembly factor BamA
LLPPPIFVAEVQDDKLFARHALGAREGQGITEERLYLGLAAIRATDRFRAVRPEIEIVGGARVLKIYLDRWPKLKRIEIAVPSGLEKRVKPMLHDLRKGSRPGDIALESWKQRALEWLAVWGFPDARIDILRLGEGDELKVGIDPGRPQLIRQLALSGNIGRVEKKIMDDLKALLLKRPTNWTSEARREVVRLLNKRYAKQKQLFATAVFNWDPEKGLLGVEIESGPTVAISAAGPKLRAGQIKKQLALPSVDGFGEGLLDETDRRLTAKLAGSGRPLAAVRHSLVPVADRGRVDSVRVDYRVDRGEVLRVGEISFLGNKEVADEELMANLKVRGVFSSIVKATPTFADAANERVLGHYISLGYADARVWHEWKGAGKKFVNLAITIYEGRKQELKEIEIALGEMGAQEREAIVAQLFNFFDFRATARLAVGLAEFETDSGEWIRSKMRWQATGDGTYKLEMLGSPPYQKIHVAELRSTLQNALASIGVQNPRVDVDPQQTGTGNNVKVTLTVPPQGTARLRRMVIQGAERTSAEFLFDLMRPKDNSEKIWYGTPLVNSKINDTRRILGSQGIFNSVDVRRLENPAESQLVGPSLWEPGDLVFRLRERKQWDFSSSFSYDRAFGYQIGAGVQRINIGGRAKTADFSMRAGDGTINNSTLRKFFTTGDPTRSLDVYSVGFSDPWLSTKALSGLLAERALWRSEAAYIKERQNAYLIFRRRYTSSLEWRLGEDVNSEWRSRKKKKNSLAVRFGYRFENVGVIGPDESEMQGLVKSPAQSTLSIPFVQFLWDARDNPFDPKSGSVFLFQLDAALQAFGTSQNSSYIKADVRYVYNLPVGSGAKFGIVSLAARVGAARPTASTSLEMPLSERFFAGGPNSHRGIEPDQLGPFGWVYVREPNYPYKPITVNGRERYRITPIGGQGIALVNLDYRFPLPMLSQWIWGEVFVDSGEVYSRVRDFSRGGVSLPEYPHDQSPFLHWRTSVGTGLILRLGGYPIKIEYAWDVRKILGKEDEIYYQLYIERTRLKNLLVSVGVQF